MLKWDYRFSEIHAFLKDSISPGEIKRGALRTGLIGYFRASAEIQSGQLGKMSEIQFAAIFRFVAAETPAKRFRFTQKSLLESLNLKVQFFALSC